VEYGNVPAPESIGEEQQQGRQILKAVGHDRDKKTAGFFAGECEDQTEGYQWGEGRNAFSGLSINVQKSKHHGGATQCQPATAASSQKPK
jgi:hypothetical protein